MMPVLGMMVHACNSSTWEVEAMSWAWGQPASHEKMSEKNNSGLLRQLSLTPPGLMTWAKTQNPHDGSEEPTPKLSSDFHMYITVLKHMHIHYNK